MKIVQRKLTLEEVIKKIKMVTAIEPGYGCLRISLDDGWIWPTTFALTSNCHIACKESELKKVMEWVKEYEKVYQEEYETRPEMTIVYDGGK
jgi:hypothetical protein